MHYAKRNKSDKFVRERQNLNHLTYIWNLGEDKTTLRKGVQICGYHRSG